MPTHQTKKNQTQTRALSSLATRREEEIGSIAGGVSMHVGDAWAKAIDGVKRARRNGEEMWFGKVRYLGWVELIGSGRSLGAQVRLMCVGPKFFSFLCWKHNWVLGAKQAEWDISSLLGNTKWVIK